MTEAERPLVTFALFAYNQERFIQEAVAGVLAQDYSPLEIILSDDCSTDRTFEIMQEMVAAYQGTHTIRLNRNIENLGIAGHLNAVMSLVKTDFVVVAAGDDISMPERTTELVLAWLRNNKMAKSIHSYAQEINEDGALTGTLRKGGEDLVLGSLLGHASQNLWVLGATQGWEMSLIREFQPILSNVVNEDVILPARAAILGTTYFVAKPLIKYRVGIGLSHEVFRRRAAGKYNLSVSLLKRPYYSFLQKYRDYREHGLLGEYRDHFSRARATALFPIWLRIGKFSLRKLIFFMRRCKQRDMIWEVMKYKLPTLVAFKQQLQFGLVEFVHAARGRQSDGRYL